MAIPRTIKTEELQSATTITSSETLIGKVIDTRNFNTLTFYFDYTKGDETYLALIPKVLRAPSGDEHQLTEWSTDAEATLTQRSFKMTASVKSYFVLDVRGLNQIKIYGKATGGTPTGTLQAGYTVVSE